MIHWIQGFVQNYPARANVPAIYRPPLVAFADADHPYLKRLPELVMPSHKLPQDFLPDARVVISYFVPFTKEHGDANQSVPGNYAARSWAQSYNDTNAMLAALNQALADLLRTLGYAAVVPYDIDMDEDVLKSPWSQRHIAYAAGLGTFGVNNMLLTEAGCCGRLSSVVTNAPLPPGAPLTEERCLYKQSGKCLVCVKHCFAHALTPAGFDRQKCRAMNARNIEKYGEDCCGKCDIALPCSYRLPGRRSASAG